MDKNGRKLAFTPNMGDVDAVQAEWEKLEGTWQLLSAVNDGKETPLEIVNKIRVLIQGRKHTVFFGDEIAVKETPFLVNPATDPKTTVDTLPDGSQIKGIYMLEGDLLTSCVASAGQEPPVEFVSKPGSGHILRVFKRIQV